MRKYWYGFLDLLATVSLVWRVVRGRSDSRRVLKALLADAVREMRQQRIRADEAEGKLERLEVEVKEKASDLGVAQREIKGLVRAHDLLCKQMDARSARYAADTLRYELLSGGGQEEHE